MNIEIQPAQIRKIKTLQGVIGLEDGDYRLMLNKVAGVNSCKELKGPKIDLVIRHLEKCAGQTKTITEPARVTRARGGLRMATNKQLFAIRRIWARVSFSQDKWGALDAFLKNRFGVERLLWLTFFKAGKVIEALKEMDRRSSGPVGRGLRGEQWAGTAKSS